MVFGTRRIVRKVQRAQIGEPIGDTQTGTPVGGLFGYIRTVRRVPPIDVRNDDENMGVDDFEQVEATAPTVFEDESGTPLASGFNGQQMPKLLFRSSLRSKLRLCVGSGSASTPSGSPPTRTMTENEDLYKKGEVDQDDTGGVRDEVH